jgi:hypothetical protein
VKYAELIATTAMIAALATARPEAKSPLRTVMNH